jgi:uncharacterized protein
LGVEAKDPKMKNLRASSYLNHVEIGDGTSMLYSGSTQCIDLVPTEYANLLSDGADLSLLSSEEKEHLLQRGHLTALTPKRELEEFRKLVQVILQKSGKFDKKQKMGNLSFILTYNCNLSCSYCYQKSLGHDFKVPPMSPELVDSIFTTYLSQLFPKIPREFTFTLFGGEPLLPANREAIARILAYTKKHPSIRVSVATNATTLSEMVDLIGPEKGKIQSVQVTLDGDQLFHDKNRIPQSGKPTFDAMIAAVRQIIQSKAHVVIRMHVHSGRLESSRNLVDFLEKEKILGHPQVGVYFAPINTFTCGNSSSEDIDIFRQTFQAVAVRTNRPPSNYDFMNKFLEMQTERIIPKVRHCGLGTDIFYVVDPLGDIYQCYEEAGHKDRRVGTFSRGKVKFFVLKEKYSRRNLLNVPECLKCSAALYCGGGCPCHARIHKGSIFKSYCHQNKEFAAQTLKAFYLENKSKNEV